jgi:hypothetical protein
VVDVEADGDGGASVVLQRSPLEVDVVWPAVGANGSYLPLLAPLAPTIVHADRVRLDWPVDCFGSRVTHEMNDC